MPDERGWRIEAEELPILSDLLAGFYRSTGRRTIAAEMAIIVETAKLVAFCRRPCVSPA